MKENEKMRSENSEVVSFSSSDRHIYINFNVLSFRTTILRILPIRMKSVQVKI